MKKISVFLSALVALLFSVADTSAQITPPYYNPANVRITGGTINGTVIGGTTAAAGSFTALNATDTFTGTANPSTAQAIKLIGRSGGNNDAQIAFFRSDGTTSTGFFNSIATGLQWYGPAGSLVTSFTDAGLAVTGTLIMSGYTVASLPAGTVGMRAYVTDALAPAFGAAVVGGGAVVIPVFYNGAAWIVG